VGAVECRWGVICKKREKIKGRNVYDCIITNHKSQFVKQKKTYKSLPLAYIKGTPADAAVARANIVLPVP